MVYAKSRKSRPKSSFPKRRRKISMSVRRVAQIARRIVSRTEEVKINRFVQNGFLFSSANALASSYAVTGDLWCLSPHASFCSISQGVGESDRIGNKIKIKNVRLKINMTPYGYDGTNNLAPRPFYVKIWIFSLRYSNQLTDVQSTIFNNFIDSNNSSVGISGGQQDLTGVVNKYNVHLKKVIIRKIGTSNYGGTGANLGQQSFANNDFKIAQFVNMDITKYVKKYVQYNDTSNTPATDLTWAYAETIPFDNVQAGCTIAGNYNLCIETKYTDS